MRFLHTGTRFSSVVEESGAPVLLVVRLKVVADKLTEVEPVATRNAVEERNGGWE